MKKAIGIDIGGTKISIVLGDESGNLIEKKILKTKLNEQTSEGVEEIKACVRCLLENNNLSQSELSGIGVGIPGPVGEIDGLIDNAPNIPGWNGLNIKEILESEFKCPVVCNNDANAAALGEYMYGSGKTSSTFVYVTISTGVGSGIVVNDRLLMGANNNAGELGHVLTDFNGPLCNCGKRGCLERLASGTAIGQMANDLVGNDEDVIDSYKNEFAYSRYSFEDKDFCLPLGSTLKDIESITAPDVVHHASQGDLLSKYILFRSGYYCGVGLSGLIQILNPDVIALGGSVTKAGDIYFDAMNTALGEHAWPSPLKKCCICKAQLKEDVADYGTIALVFSADK